MSVLFRKMNSLIYKSLYKLKICIEIRLQTRNIKFNQKYILKSNSKVSFENKIRIKWMKSNPQFGSIEHFYQTHPKIGVPGLRPTLSRFKNYELMNLVNSDSDILDVGGNVGMFSSYVSQFV